MTLTVDRHDTDTLVERAEALLARGGRTLLGIVGAPGSGKSTLAAEVVARLGGRALVVPMDGFHLAHAELERLGRDHRKGALDTFDGGGFLSLVRRLAAADEDVVYAPEFRREIEEPIAGAIGVERSVPLVVLEGNYLLVDAPIWREVAPLLAESWFVEPDEGVRLERLVTRHVEFGRTAEQAEAHATGSDQTNAVLIASTRDRADVVVRG